MSITDPLIGCQLGDYRIMDLLGRGGMARVYRGYDARLERYAAVKVIDSSLTQESEADYRERFQREARSIARLNHPRIVGVYQFGEADSVYYMAMAFIDGRNLGQVLRTLAAENRLMAPREILRIVRDVAGALDHAHAGGVIHRDVKPSNIMVTADGHAVLTDFGLALSVPDGSGGDIFGSAHYIAPEQAVSSADAVPQSDLYSLGVILYQMLTGRVPFDDPSAMVVALKHLHEPPLAPGSVNPDLSPEVEAVVLRLLDKDPARRFQSGAALVRALEGAMALHLNGDGVGHRASMLPRMKRVFPSSFASFSDATQDTQPSSLHRPRSSRIPLWAVLFLIALLAGGAGLLLLTRDDVRSLVDRTPTSNASIGLVVSASPTRAVRPTQTARASQESSAGAAAVTDEATSTETSTGTPTETPPASATPRPSRTPTEEPTNTRIPTLTSTSTPTLFPTETPIPVVIEPSMIAPTEAGMSIRLIYGETMFVLVNESNEPVDVSELVFVQTEPDGSTLTFRSNAWEQASALQGNSCFQVWTSQFTQRPIPPYCGERQSWQAVSYPRWFWISADDDATFEVRRGDDLLAICQIEAGECSVRIED